MLRFVRTHLLPSAAVMACVGASAFAQQLPWHPPFGTYEFVSDASAELAIHLEQGNDGECVKVTRVSARAYDLRAC